MENTFCSGNLANPPKVKKRRTNPEGERNKRRASQSNMDSRTIHNLCLGIHKGGPLNPIDPVAEKKARMLRRALEFAAAPSREYPPQVARVQRPQLNADDAFDVGRRAGAQNVSNAALASVYASADFRHPPTHPYSAWQPYDDEEEKVLARPPKRLLNLGAVVALLQKTSAAQDAASACSWDLVGLGGLELDDAESWCVLDDSKSETTDAESVSSFFKV